MILHEKLTVVQVVKKFITVLTTVGPVPSLWNPTHTLTFPLLPTLHIVLPRSLLSSGFPTQIPHTFKFRIINSTLLKIPELSSVIMMYKISIKVSLILIRRHFMTAYGGLEVQLQAPAPLIFGTQRREGCMGPKFGPDALQNTSLTWQPFSYGLNE